MDSTAAIAWASVTSAWSRVRAEAFPVSVQNEEELVFDALDGQLALILGQGGG